MTEALVLGSILGLFSGMIPGPFSGEWRARPMRSTSAALLVAGTVLLWQSYEGNFQQMVTGSETIETLVTDSILGGR